ncbi:amidohydrolase [Actinomadura formosensis]|uniref:amidohydrolase n=1 Tax=Actinomadura formosensis TaxID=60706 RepID=UPI00082DAEBA|nr:amidohydrolase [Actinomadura formosensis]
MTADADLVLDDAVVHGTGLAAPANAIAVKAGWVVAAGDAARAMTARRRVSLGGRTVIPGFHDGHVHTGRFGMGLRQVDLSDATSLDEVYERVARRAAELPAGSWLIAHSYDHTALGDRHPSRGPLDRVAPGHLVWLKHRTEHMGVANSRLLARAGVDRSTRVDGGTVDLDADGVPTGLLVETAQAFVNDLIVPVSHEELVQAIDAAHTHYLSQGVTSCQEAGVGGGWIGLSPDEALAYEDALARGMLRVRTVLMPSYEVLEPSGPHGELRLPDHLPHYFTDPLLRWGPVKIFADGALSTRTAAVTEDFCHHPGQTGLLQAEPETLRDRIVAAHRSGWQIATHAIGDRAIDVVLAAYQECLGHRLDDDPRFRIEHCSVVRPDQVTRMAALGVVPVMQNFFVEALGDVAEANLGPDRARWCYRLRSLLDRGVPVANSSDRPIAEGAPLRALHRMLVRRTASGAPFGEEERIDPLSALKVATWNPAFACRMEGEVGLLQPGYRADIAVLDDDPVTADPDRVGAITVAATFVNGELKYDAMGTGHPIE